MTKPEWTTFSIYCGKTHLKSDFIFVLAIKAEIANIGANVYFKVFIFVTLYFEDHFTITPEEVTKRKLRLQYDHSELICVDILPTVQGDLAVAF